MSDEAIELSDEMAARRAKVVELHDWLEELMVEASQGNEVNLFLLRGHFFHGLSIQESAQQCGLTAKSVYCRIHRLLEKLREAAEKKFQQ